MANIDYAAFLRFTAGASNPTLNAAPALRKLKTVVAFDSVGVTDLPAGTLAGESNLFGSATQRYMNYSEWAWNNNRVAGDGSGLDDTGKTWAQFIATDTTVTQQLKLINPVQYLKSSSSNPAPYWYVRHGMLDRDTSPAIQIVLRQALKNNSAVKETNFKFSYGIGHTGFTDVAESFDWIKAKLTANP